MFNSENDPDSALKEITREDLQVYSMVAGAIWMISGGLLIYFFHDKTMAEMLRMGQSVIYQLGWGLLVGLAFGFAASFLISRPSMEKINDDFMVIKIIRNLNLDRTDIIQISLIAGITEEFLFRGALQPILGLWLTAIIFVAIHGYFRFTSAPHIFFGVFMLTLSAGLGYLMHFSGIFAAMAAHVVYDYVVIRKLTLAQSRELGA